MLVELFGSVLQSALSFALVISIIVFVHEFGHFIVARWLGVKVEVFSIGFGTELIGRTDKHGTRWKLAALPLGGYVKMFGDAGAASNADTKKLRKMTKAEKAQSFHFKPLWAKFAIVASGPLFNFILAIGVFTYFVMTVGIASTEPVVGGVMPKSAAYYAGIKKGDRVIAIDGQAISQFNDITDNVMINLGTEMIFTLERRGRTITRVVTPRIVEEKDQLGNMVKRPLVGLKSTQLVFEKADLPQAMWEAVKRTYHMCVMSLKFMGQMIVGDRGTEDMKGPLGIAKLSGDVAESGETIGETTRMFLWFIALLSVNLGLVNLFPIPMLDGGHLMFYIIEALRGQPMTEKFQEWSYRIGLAVITCLAVFTIFNDLWQMR